MPTKSLSFPPASAVHKHLGRQQLVRALACLCRKKRRQIRGVIGRRMGRDADRLRHFGPY
jgi:hypothetical protein